MVSRWCGKVLKFLVVSDPTAGLWWRVLQVSIRLTINNGLTQICPSILSSSDASSLYLRAPTWSVTSVIFSLSLLIWMMILSWSIWKKLLGRSFWNQINISSSRLSDSRICPKFIWIESSDKAFANPEAGRKIRFWPTLEQDYMQISLVRLVLNATEISNCNRTALRYEIQTKGNMFWKANHLSRL